VALCRRAEMCDVAAVDRCHHEFRGNPVTSFSSDIGFIPFHADFGGLWGEVNVGISGKVNLNTTLYANASYQSRFDGGGFAYTGKAGLRVNW
jgi:outer membrane autotransporter protein